MSNGMRGVVRIPVVISEMIKNEQIKVTGCRFASF